LYTDFIKRRRVQNCCSQTCRRRLYPWRLPWTLFSNWVPKTKTKFVYVKRNGCTSCI
jgi:hypothetical protein